MAIFPCERSGLFTEPAAYYVPMVSRMDRVEVVTGPSAITHGPNTVGGTINLITRPIPSIGQGGVDVQRHPPRRVVDGRGERRGQPVERRPVVGHVEVVERVQEVVGDCHCPRHGHTPRYR